MRVIWLSILLFYSFHLFALTPSDSLKNELNRVRSKKDRIDLYFKIGKVYMEDFPDSALYYFNQSLNLSTEINLKPGIAKSYLYQAKALNIKKEYKKAIQIIRLAEKAYSKITDQTGIAKCYYENGVSYYRLGNNDSTLYYLNKALLNFDKEVNLLEIADAERIKSVCYWSMGKYAEGLLYINNAIEIYKQIEDYSNLSTSLNTKGAVLWGMANYEAALNSYFESLYLLDEKKDKSGRFIVLYNNIGMVYNDWGYKEMAFNYFQRANELVPETTHKIGIAFTNLNLGTYYFENGEIQKALDFLEKSKNGYTEENDINGICLTKIITGKCYSKEKKYDLAENILLEAVNDSEISENNHRKSLAYYNLAENELNQNKFEEAVSYALQSRKLAEDGGYKDLLHLLDYQLSIIYEANGNLDKSIEMLKSALSYKDEISKEKEAVQYQILQKNRENELNALENEKLKSQIELRGKTILYIALTVVLVTIMFVMTLIFNFSLSKHKRELQKANATKDKIFSIVAHDLRGPVGNLNNMIDIMVDEEKEYDYREILNSFKPIIARTYNMLENLLVWAKSNLGKLDYNRVKIPIHKTIKETIQLVSNIASKKSISIIFHSTEERYVLADLVLLQTIIRNLLNNAIKFTQENGRIEISTKVVHKLCIISIADNGIGIPEDKQKLLFTGELQCLGTNDEKGSGLGIILCKELAEKNEGSLWYESKEGVGSTFYFSVPVFIEKT